MNEPSPPSSTADHQNGDWLQSLGTTPAAQPTTGNWLSSLGGAARANGTVVTAATEPHAAAAPPQVSGYEILGVLGRGGMGVVYRARHLALNRQVALKMILSGAHADPHDLARFRAEAEAVAKFTHPHIVQVFEVGIHEGLPYCALELIPGGSVEEQFRGQPQPPRQAATLMVPVAQAVQAAHDQGIIHRDLKPANILLAADGTPKLTDFGLAKRWADDNGQTRTGDIVGTPSYMAPEQAAGQVREVGPAADIYALGTILYQLLTGRPPFQGLSPMDTALQVLTAEPVPPRQLQPTVPRDLETICLKCLHKEPAKRYATAAALTTDLQHYLDGKPILARPAGRWERTVKWCRRYPAVAALVAVVTLAAVGMGTLAVWAWSAEQEARQERDQKEEQRRQAEVERQKAEVERRKAVEQADLATAIKYFLQFNVLELADPKVQHQEQARGVKYDANVKLQDVVLRAAKAINGKFPTQPLVEAELRWTIGQTLLGMGRPEVAVVQLERCRTLYTQQFGPDHINTLQSVHNLAMAYIDLGRHAEALKLHEENLARRQATLGPDHPETLGSRLSVAHLYAILGRPAEALKLHEDTLARQKKVRGPDHPETLASMNNLASIYAALGRHTEALQLLEKTVQLKKAKLGPDHPDTLGAMSNLATSYSILGRSAEAVQLHQYIRERREATLGPDHPQTLESMYTLALGYTALGRFAEAQATYTDLIGRLEAWLTKHPAEGRFVVTLAGAYCNLGSLLRDHGPPAAALPWFAKGEARLETLLAQEPRNAMARLFLRNIHWMRAQTCERLQRFGEADADWGKAIDLSPAREKTLVTTERDQWKAKRKP